MRQRLHAAGVHTLLVQFADVHGTAKGKLVPLAHLATVLEAGAGFAGPSIWGTGLARTGARSEYIARGDASTLQPLPWQPGVARIVGDGVVDGRPFDACPRQVLRRALARLAERGWRLEVGIEPEFFLLRRLPGGGYAPLDDHDRLDKPSYDLKSLARAQPLLHDLRTWLEACGLDVTQVDHEDAHGQYEVNFTHADALASADRVMLFKLAAQAAAEKHGAVFSLMPKPFADQPGSGMHFHVSLWAGDRGLFDADRAGVDLSPLGRHFVAGVLAHAPALCALAAPTVNSYKRLAVYDSITGTTWAPVWVAHGPNNRTALVRTLRGRFEWRLPDASANPYLALAGLIAAGLDGVDRALDPGPACHDDLYALDGDGHAALALPRLPTDLARAVDALEADDVVGAALGETLAREFARLKRAEWQAYAQQVTPWELARYAERF
nr:type III glutamate--ammonia ligase [Calidifontimicrobium sp. SYSU G02091]